MDDVKNGQRINCNGVHGTVIGKQALAIADVAFGLIFGNKRLVKNNLQVDRDEREDSRIAASSARKTLL